MAEASESLLLEVVNYVLSQMGREGITSFAGLSGTPLDGLDGEEAALASVNWALFKIGKTALESFEDDANPVLASTAKKLWPEAYDAVCAMHPWKRLRRVADLSPTVEGPGQMGMYQYSWPNDFVRQVSAYGDAGGRAELYATLSGFMSPERSVSLVYVARPSSPSKLPPDLRELFSCKIAQMLAPVYVGDSQSASLSESWLNAAFLKSIEIDGEYGPDPELGQMPARQDGGYAYRRPY